MSSPPSSYRLLRRPRRGRTCAPRTDETANPGALAAGQRQAPCYRGEDDRPDRADAREDDQRARIGQSPREDERRQRGDETRENGLPPGAPDRPRRDAAPPREVGEHQDCRDGLDDERRE